MRQENLPSPGIHRNGQRLRIEAAKAISFAEIQNDRSQGTNIEDLQRLRAFFQACADAVPTVDSPDEPEA